LLGDGTGRTRVDVRIVVLEEEEVEELAAVIGVPAATDRDVGLDAELLEAARGADGATKTLEMLGTAALTDDATKVLELLGTAALDDDLATGVLDDLTAAALGVLLVVVCFLVVAALTVDDSTRSIATRADW